MMIAPEPTQAHLIAPGVRRSFHENFVEAAFGITQQQGQHAWLGVDIMNFCGSPHASMFLKDFQER